MLWDSNGKKKFYMDLGRFLKSSEGCFFVFNEKGNYDIVCNKLKQLRLFAASGRNTCLFTSDVANVIDYMNRYRVSCHTEGFFIGSFYDFAYDFLKRNNIVDIAAYKTEGYVDHVIEDLFSRGFISSMHDVENVKVEFYKRESEQFLKMKLDSCKNKWGNYVASGIVFEKGTEEGNGSCMTAIYNEYLEYKRKCGFLDGEDVLFLLYRCLREDSHLRTSFSLLLQDVFVLDFSTITPLQTFILQECFSLESLYMFLIDNNEKCFFNHEFVSKISEYFPGSFFLDFSTGNYSVEVFDCANDFLEVWCNVPRVQEKNKNKSSFKNNEFGEDNSFAIRRRCSDFFDVNACKDKVITFLSSTIENKEVDLISLAMRRVVNNKRTSPSDIIVFATKEKCDTVMRVLKKDGIKVSEKGSVGVRVEDIKNACRVNEFMYVFIYGLSSSDTYIAEIDFYFALLSATKKVFLSYSLMSNVGGEFVNLVRSKFLDMLNNRFVNEEVLTASKISICNKEFSFDNKATVFSYSFIKKKSLVGK